MERTAPAALWTSPNRGRVASIRTMWVRTKIRRSRVAAATASRRNGKKTAAAREGWWEGSGGRSAGGCDDDAGTEGQDGTTAATRQGLQDGGRGVCCAGWRYTFDRELRIRAPMQRHEIIQYGSRFPVFETNTRNAGAP